MPIYEYSCPKCGTFEVVQKASEKPLKAKPDCGDAECPCKAERLISASAFHLKGSGWYKTDYASSSSAGGGKSPSSSSSSESSSSSDGGSEKKSSLKTAGSCGGGCSCH